MTSVSIFLNDLGTLSKKKKEEKKTFGCESNAVLDQPNRFDLTLDGEITKSVLRWPKSTKPSESRLGPKQPIRGAAALSRHSGFSWIGASLV